MRASLGCALVVGTLLLSLVSSAPISYAGYKVLRLTVQPNQLDMLRELESDLTLDLDWWKELPTSTMVTVTADAMVSPYTLPIVTSWLESHGVTYTTMVDDVNVAIKVERIAAPSLGNNVADWFTAYHDVNETQTWTKALVAQYSSLATLQIVGNSYEGRQIQVVKVSGKSSGSVKPVIFYDGGIHAREWIAPATVQYILYQLLSQYGHDSEVTKLVDSIDWYIVPILNVDGNQYTHTKDRMWRKTRAPNAGSSCVGTDPCRNSATGWGGEGSSSSPCSDEYHGKKAFDQIEMASLSQFLAKIPNLRGYINFHSYSQLFMSPYGYTTALPPASDLKTQTELGQAFVAAIKATHGKTYIEGPVATTIYKAAGVISDWTYAQLNVTYSYACELRDTGAHGFILPPDQIIPTGEEIFAGVRVMGNYILQH